MFYYLLFQKTYQINLSKCKKLSLILWKIEMIQEEFNVNNLLMLDDINDNDCYGFGMVINSYYLK